MKRTLALSVVVLLALSGCGSEKQVIEEAVYTQEEESENIEKSNENEVDFPSSEQLLLALKSKNSNLMDIEVFDEETDPNELLGRPGYYITKADFSDSRVQQIGEYLCGGTIETFSSEDDCENRTEYLNGLNDPSQGALALNQYIYQYDKVLFRITYDLTPEQAEEYYQQMTEIIEQYNRDGFLVSEEDSKQIEKSEGTETTEDLASQMEITEYSMENIIGDTLYFLVIKNNSDETVEINVNAIAKDKEGKTIGATDSTENAVASGSEVCLCNYFDGVKDADEFEYTMTVKKETFFKPVMQDIDIEESKTDEKVILTCTNNGDDAAQFVEAYALFFNDGELVNYDSTYITDDDSEIKPGSTISSELNCYGGYDDVKLYVNGRR